MSETDDFGTEAQIGTQCGGVPNDVGIVRAERVGAEEAPRRYGPRLPGEAAAHADGRRHGEAGPGTLLFGVAAPEPALAVTAGEVPAREGGATGGTQPPGLALAADPGLRALGSGGEED